MMIPAIEIDHLLPATLTAPALDEAQFLELCAKFPDALLEYTAEGTVLINPLNDPETTRTVMLRLVETPCSEV